MTSTKMSQPTPISVSTSQNWENDGSGYWSSFIVEVGTPAQSARVLISTASDETWVVINLGCPDNYGKNCAFNRGYIFDVDNSTSWTNISTFELDLELNLDYDGNGLFGHDVVSLGYPLSGGPQLSNQIVAGIAAPDFWLGIFGLDPAPSNFTNLNDPQPSFLWTLVNEFMIPSTTWGYTAGAYYSKFSASAEAGPAWLPQLSILTPAGYDKVQGSLTLGGYDTSRFGSKNLTFPMYEDVARRFIVELQAITYLPTGVSTVTTPTTLMSEKLSMYIDSTTSYIYLPTNICEHFELAFGIQWDNVSEIYTINDTMHSLLRSTRPNITFSLSNTAGEILEFTLPYMSFDLSASIPVLPNGTNATTYFPLKRADNDTQYTLGRVFLQEAYLIADYDRSTFTISPCIWPATFNSSIHAIYPPTSNSTNTTITTTSTISKHSRPLGGIIGGTVGGFLLIVLVIPLYWKFFWNPKHRSQPPTTKDEKEASSSILSDKPELDASNRRAELATLREQETGREVVQIAGTPIMGVEMDTHVVAADELDSSVVHEMPAWEPVRTELPSSGVGDYSLLRSLLPVTRKDVGLPKPDDTGEGYHDDRYVE